MRLVSAIYPEHYPFNAFSLFTEFFHTIDPDDLRAGDVLIVWGGEDISPSLYNHGRSSMSGAQVQISRRDYIEWRLMQRARTLSIPIIGICRGAQMLCALQDGYLVQHVTGHGGHHDVHTKDGGIIETNSLHHQMMVPKGEHELVAWTTPRSKMYYVCETGRDDVKEPGWLDKEPEFIYYPTIRGFAVQWHPEYTNYPDQATDYLFKFMQERLTT